MKVYKLIIDLENPIDKVIKVPENTDWGLHIWPINTKMVFYPLRFKLTGEGLDEQLTVGYKNVNEEHENIDVYYGDYDKTWPNFQIHDTLPKRDAGEKLTWTYEIVSEEPVEWYPEVDKTIVGKVCNITVEYIKSNDNAFTVVDVGNPSAYSKGLSNYYGLLTLGEGWQEIAIGNRGTGTTEPNCAVSIFASGSIGTCSREFNLNAESINLNGCVYINDEEYQSGGTSYTSITENSGVTKIENDCIYMIGKGAYIKDEAGCILEINSYTGCSADGGSVSDIAVRANQIRLVGGQGVSITTDCLAINGKKYQHYTRICEESYSISLNGDNKNINVTVSDYTVQITNHDAAFWIESGNCMAMCADGINMQTNSFFINGTNICLTKFLADYGM